jgi:ADP-L-glycero-D-manno-heptose 6-epimerase
MYVVTGGAGFIGSVLVKYLNQKGVTDIIVVDDLTDASKFLNLKSLKFSSYIDVDDLDLHNLARMPVTKVFHIGGISSTTETNGKRLLKYNYTHTINWHNFCSDRGIPLVYLSSASVYGNSQTFCETDSLDPLNAYAYSKALSEQALTTLGLENTWIFRPFNVYGSQEHHKGAQASPVYKFQQQFAQTGRVEVFSGSDGIYRDFISVVDVVDVLVNYTHSDPGIYNLGTGSTHSFGEIAKLVTNNVVEVPFPEYLKNKYQFYSKADLTRLQTLVPNHKFVTVQQFYDHTKRINQ